MPAEVIAVAAPPTERPDSAMDRLKRVSLLDIVTQRAAELQRTTIIHRLILVGRLKDDQESRPELGEHLQAIVKSYSERGQELDSITGLLLIYPNFFVHILEARDRVIEDVLGSMADCQDHHELVTATKVVLCTRHIPERLFTGWNYRLLSVADIRGDESLNQMDIKAMMQQILTKMCGLSYEFTKLPKRLKSSELDQLTVKYQQFLLSQDMISSLLSSKDLLTSHEFLNRYSEPLHETLEGEMVWPPINNLNNS